MPSSVLAPCPQPVTRQSLKAPATAVPQTEGEPPQHGLPSAPKGDQPRTPQACFPTHLGFLTLCTHRAPAPPCTAPPRLPRLHSSIPLLQSPPWLPLPGVSPPAPELRPFCFPVFTSASPSSLAALTVSWTPAPIQCSWESRQLARFLFVLNE